MIGNILSEMSHLFLASQFLIIEIIVQLRKQRGVVCLDYGEILEAISVHVTLSRFFEAWMNTFSNFFYKKTFINFYRLIVHLLSHFISTPLILS